MTGVRRIAGDWLATRRAADGAAREASRPLVRDLAGRLAGESAVALVDLGAGTGANPAWLAPALADAGAPTQHWVLVDHDRELLASGDVPRHEAVVSATRVEGGVETLAAVLVSLPRPRVVSCSALLDLLTPGQIQQCVADVVAGADAALLALTVSGTFRIDPAHPDDDLLVRAFNAHQQRTVDLQAEPLAGPDGWRVAAAAFRGAGWLVSEALTPWHLGPAQEPLLRRWMAERVEAAAETVSCDAVATSQVERWWQDRSSQIDRGVVTAEVDHVDLLALPPGPEAGAS
jgi:hypothetical protein